MTPIEAINNAIEFVGDECGKTSGSLKVRKDLQAACDSVAEMRACLFAMNNHLHGWPRYGHSAESSALLSAMLDRADKVLRKSLG